MWYISLYVDDRLVCKSAYQTVTYIEWDIPDVLIQLILLMMSTWVLETCRDLE